MLFIFATSSVNKDECKPYRSWQSLQQWLSLVAATRVDRLRVTPGSGRPAPFATLQIDFIHSASAIGTWTVKKEFEISLTTLTDFFVLLLNLDWTVVPAVFSTGI